MLSSKANAALTRLREIEEKYRMKRKEQEWNRKERDVDSSISSISINPSDNLLAELKESPKNISKPRLDIRMPDARFEKYTENTKVSSEDEESILDIEEPKSVENVDRVDSHVTMPLEDKLHSMEKQEASFISDISVIQENSTIKSVLDHSIISSKSLSRSQKSQEEFSSLGNSSRRKERIKGDAKSKKVSDELTEKLVKYGAVKLPNIKPTKLSATSSEAILEPHSNRKLQENLIKTSKTANLRRDSSDLDRLDNVIDESIGTTENGSEIFSELSNVEQNVPEKSKDARTNAPNKFKQPATVDASVHISDNLKHPVAENEYANDTFEDLSSSTVFSKSRSRSEKIIKKEKHTDSGALVHLSTVNVERNTYDFSAISYLAKSSSDDVTEMEESAVKKNSSEIKMDSISKRQENVREENEKPSNEMKECATIDVTRLPITDDIENIASEKFSLLKEKNEKREREEDAFKEFQRQWISEDTEYVTRILRKLHRDVLDTMARRYGNLKTMKETSESFLGGKPGEMMTKAVMTKRGDENYSSFHHDDHEHSSKKRNKRVRAMNSKSAEARNSFGSHKEDNGKQTHRVRKRVVELKLLEEKTDLRKYLHELKDFRLRFRSEPTHGYFSPLEFPKIMEFTVSDKIDLEHDHQYIVLYERISAIRQWLKDQYILYRDYCTMTQAINACYVPTTLEDAKKTIRELRKTTIKTG